MNLHFDKLESLKRFDNSKVSVRGVVYDVSADDALLLKVKEVDGRSYEFNMLLRLIDFDSGSFSYGDEIYAISSFSIPRPAGYRGDFSWDVYYMSRGIYAIGSSSFNRVTIEEHNYGIINIENFGFLLRQKFLDFIVEAFPDEESDILISILFGGKGYIDDYFYEKVKYIGIAHVFAISGLNISIIVLLLTNICKAIFWQNSKINIICIFSLVLLHFIIGYSPSVSRAIIMCIINLLGVFVYRLGEKYTTLAISAFCILVFYPLALFDISFLLSFVSTLFIMMFDRINIPNINSNKLCSFIVDNIGLCCFSGLGNIPISAYFFNTFSIGAVLGNVIVAPFVGVIVCAGYLFCILSVIFQPLAFIIIYPIYLMLYILKSVINILGNIPYLVMEVPTPSLGFILLYYFLLVIFIGFIRLIINSPKQKGIEY